MYLVVDEFTFQTSYHHLRQRRQLDLPESWPPASILKKVADKKKRIVVAGVTCGYLDFADNFVQSLERNGVTNYLLVPLDAKSLEILQQAYPDHTVPMMPGIQSAPSEAHFWAKKDFKTITATRPEFLTSFLTKGYTVMYNDIDRVWLQNVWNEMDVMISRNKKLTLILVDDSPGLANRTASNNYSTSLMYLEPTDRNIHLLRSWRNAIKTDKEDRVAGDQGYFNDIFAAMKKGPSFAPHDWTKAYTGDFPTGNDYFWDYKNYSHYDHNIQVVHANYLVGKKTKQKRLLEMGHWNLSGKIPADVTCDGK
jgi:rhamnogalacturonan II specific xylosyltransferase